MLDHFPHAASVIDSDSRKRWTVAAVVDENDWKFIAWRKTGSQWSVVEQNERVHTTGPGKPLDQLRPTWRSATTKRCQYIEAILGGDFIDSSENLRIKATGNPREDHAKCLGSPAGQRSRGVGWHV
jgi:hypothetical protein